MGLALSGHAGLCPAPRGTSGQMKGCGIPGSALGGYSAAAEVPIG